MARRILAYECQYCGAIKRNKKIAERHEITCMSNPEAKNCILCIHRRRIPVDLDGGGELVCNRRQITCSRAVSAKCEHFSTERSLVVDAKHD